MNAKETKIQPFIEGTKQFIVPLFQRPYSWERKHWQALWDDLMDLYEEEQPRNHFMGSVVTMPAVSVPEGVTKYVLIDGQQRITTVLILLALIRDNARTLPGTLADQIENLLLLNQYQEGNEKFKLLPTQVDRDAFTRIIGGEVVTQENHVTRAYRFFDRELRAADGLKLEKLRGIIIRNLVLVSIVLDTDDNPHLIFESLNAKGRALTQADLIRNYFFMRMHVDQQETMYQTYWAPLQDKLGEDLTECIRHFLMKDGAIVKQGEVFFTLKQRADRMSQEGIVQYLKELVQYAGYYERMLHPEREPNANVRRAMDRLNRTEVTTAYPFLLNVYDDFVKSRMSESDTVEILEMLENFVLRRFVCGVPTNTLNKMFPPLYSQAKQHGNLVAGVRAVLATKNYPRDTEFRERLSTVRLYGGDRGVKGRLILERLEASFGHRETVDGSTLTIEHVMPQTLTEWWKAHLGEDWEEVHGRWLDTIGNLTLSGYNPQLSNADFSTKREILRESHVELNKHFEAVTEWNETAIRKRGEELASRALQVWKNLGPEQPDPSSESDMGPDDDVSATDVDSEMVGGGFDVSLVLDVLGGAAARDDFGRKSMYKLHDGRYVLFKYSKLHRARNCFWYGLRPDSVPELRLDGFTHVAFVMGNYGVAVVPMDELESYCSHAHVSYHPDGSIRHYHIQISNETTPHFFASADAPRYSLGGYFKKF